MEKDYDFAINEECVKYNDCAKLLPFYKSGKAIFGTEYDGDGPHICKTAEKFHIKMKYNFGDGWINCFPGTRPLPETEYYPEKVETGTPKPTLPPPTTEYCGNCTNPPNQYCYLPEGECNQEGNDCEYFKVPPGAACLNVEKGASRVCNKNGECVDLCESVTCNSPPNKECFAMLGLCNPLTGKCTYDQHQEGTPCIDPRVDLPGRCNQDGLCLHLCDPMANTMCSLPPSACYVDEGVCEEATGTCHYDKRPLGHSCITEDNQAGWCDYSGRCLSPCGILGCRTPPNRQCYVANGQCESWSGACHYDRHPQGTLCQISENEVGQCNDYGECVNVCKDVKCLSPPHPQCYLSTGVCNIMTGRCGYYRRISAEC
ncbi:hypothetical protein Zmor_004144 [Zophobas morio]|uniref:Glycoside-hydrolase family GH114 TIM-barrel domain-containing protein n=1 Tax=Zophobas morio TaxID=2755281 RepID=A0AA38M0E7_9CUCU|nr:hypothetical protein Zmor_004144 [Zophobas morio]